MFPYASPKSIINKAGSEYKIFLIFITQQMIIWTYHHSDLFWHGFKVWNNITFKVSSSKHCSTFALVLALHSRNKLPSSLARATPSSVLTALSESWDGEGFCMSHNLKMQWTNMSKWYFQKTVWDAHSVDFVPNEHLYTVPISAIQFDFLSPYIW